MLITVLILSTITPQHGNYQNGSRSEPKMTIFVQKKQYESYV